MYVCTELLELAVFLGTVVHLHCPPYLLSQGSDYEVGQYWTRELRGSYRVQHSVIDKSEVPCSIWCWNHTYDHWTNWFLIILTTRVADSTCCRTSTSALICTNNQKLSTMIMGKLIGRSAINSRNFEQQTCMRVKPYTAVKSTTQQSQCETDKPNAKKNKVCLDCL
jgi:hypothetical protein